MFGGFPKLEVMLWQASLSLSVSNSSSISSSSCSSSSSAGQHLELHRSFIHIENSAQGVPVAMTSCNFKLVGLYHLLFEAIQQTLGKCDLCSQCHGMAPFSVDVPAYRCNISPLTAIPKALFTSREGNPITRVTLAGGRKITQVYKQNFTGRVTLPPGTTLHA